MKFEMTPARRLLASGIFSAAVALAVSIHLSSERRRLTSGVEMGPVLIARKYIAAGKPVTPDAVSTKSMPRAYAEPGALTIAADLGGGGRARVSLMKGEQVTRSKVELAGSRPGLAWVVPFGRRALGLRLPTEHVAAGHLMPGDRVDVLSIPRRERAESARVLVRRARVLSVGERVWDPAEASIDTPATSGGTESVLVSLMLSPEEASNVAACSERETLMLVLASPLGESGASVEDEP